MMEIDALTAAQHYDELTASGLDALIDQYLFKQPLYCLGQSRLNAYGVYRCDACGAIDERHRTPGMTSAGRMHHRLVPAYSAEQILAAMSYRSPSTQIVFVLQLCVLICGNLASWQITRRAVLTLLARIIFGLTARNVAVAALIAVGVLDEHGYIKERGE